MKLKRSCAYLIAALSFQPAAYARGPFGSIHVGVWTGGAFTNDSTGQFTGCIASAPYVSGVVLYVMIKPDGGWNIGFSHQSWELQVGQVFPINLTFDGQTEVHVFASPISKNMVTVPMPGTSSLMAQFRKSQNMAAFAQGQLYQFSLNGTSQLLPTLTNCVALVKKNGIANVGDLTVKQPPNQPLTREPTAIAASTEIATTPPAKPVIAERRVALVVGNSSYNTVAALPNPQRDAQAIAAALRAIGFPDGDVGKQHDAG